MKKNNYLVNLLKFTTMLFIVLVLVLACRREPILESGDINLEFSTDTVMFDTIFTSIGSTTQNFLVYNTNSKAVKIKSVSLAAAGVKISFANHNLDPDAMASATRRLMRAHATRNVEFISPIERIAERFSRTRTSNANPYKSPTRGRNVTRHTPFGRPQFRSPAAAPARLGCVRPTGITALPAAGRRTGHVDLGALGDQRPTGLPGLLDRRAVARAPRHAAPAGNDDARRLPGPEHHLPAERAADLRPDDARLPGRAGQLGVPPR